MIESIQLIRRRQIAQDMANYAASMGFTAEPTENPISGPYVHLTGKDGSSYMVFTWGRLRRLMGVSDVPRLPMLRTTPRNNIIPFKR